MFGTKSKSRVRNDDSGRGGQPGILGEIDDFMDSSQKTCRKTYLTAQIIISVVSFCLCY